MEAGEVDDSTKVTVTFEIDEETAITTQVALTIQISELKRDLAEKLKWSSKGLILIDSSGNTLGDGNLGEFNGSGDMTFSVFFRQDLMDVTFTDGVKSLIVFKVDPNWQAGNTLKRMEIAKIKDVGSESELAGANKKLEKKEPLYEHIMSRTTPAMYLLRRATIFTIVDSDGLFKSMNCDRLWTEQVFRKNLTKLKAIPEPFSIKFDLEELKSVQTLDEFERGSTFTIERKNIGGHTLQPVISK